MIHFESWTTAELQAYARAHYSSISRLQSRPALLRALNRMSEKESFVGIDGEGSVTDMNRHHRAAMIEAIVNDWIAPEEDCLGQIVTDDNFGDLFNRVEALRTAGQSVEWRGAITRWTEAIEYARKSFCDLNGFSCQANPSYSELVSKGDDGQRRDFANRIKWAVMRGAIWASDANR